jgi:TRAP-type C4-dicarboxylate transport system substrate-binding protein
MMAVGMTIFTCVPSSAQEDQKWTLKMQSFSTRGPDPQWVSVEKFLDFVREETNGRLDIKAYSAGELVSTREIVSAISSGIIDAGTFTGNYIFGQYPAVDWAGIPIVKDRAEWFKVMDGGVRDYLDGLMRQDNLSLLTVYPIEDANIFVTRSKPIEKLEDFKGLKLRGVGGAMDQFMQANGVGVTTMSLSDAYTALQTGVVEGASTGLAGYYTMKGWEVAPYLTWPKGLNVTTQQVVAINAAKWDSLPDDIKEAVHRAEQRHREWDAAYLQQSKIDSIEDFKSKGTKITILSPEEAERWRQAYLKVGVPFYLGFGEQPKHVIEMAEKILGHSLTGN